MRTSDIVRFLDRYPEYPCAKELRALVTGPLSKFVNRAVLRRDLVKYEYGRRRHEPGIKVYQLVETLADEFSQSPDTIREDIYTTR